MQPKPSRSSINRSQDRQFDALEGDQKALHELSNADMMKQMSEAENKAATEAAEKRKKK